jgi:hypothetical protein
MQVPISAPEQVPISAPVQVPAAAVGAHLGASVESRPVSMPNSAPDVPLLPPSPEANVKVPPVDAAFAAAAAASGEGAMPISAPSSAEDRRLELLRQERIAEMRKLSKSPDKGSVKRLGSFTFLEEVTSNRGVGGGKKAGVELTPRSGSSTSAAVGAQLSAANQLRRPPSADFLAKITQAEKRDDVRNSPRAAAGRDEAVTAAPTADSPARPRPSAKPLGEPSPRGKLGSMIAQRQAAMAASMNATMDPSLTETLETHI